MKVLKWIGIVLGSLIGLVLVAGVVLGFMGNASLDANHAGEDFGPTELGTADVERGRYLVEEVIHCAACHGEGFAGSEGFAEGAPGVAYFEAPNITPAGVGSLMDTDDWVNALRHGVGHDGRGLLIMPSSGFATLTADDLASVIAYMQQVPAAGELTPPRDLGFISGVMVAAGMFPDEYKLAEGVEQSTVERGPTAEYGEYLDGITCITCFIDFTGYTEADFLRLATEGVLIDGSPVDETQPDWAPWANVEEDDLTAMWLYIESTQE